MCAVGVIETVGLGGEPHLLAQGQTGAGNIQQGILFRRVHRHVVFARHGGVDELDDDVRADAFEIAVSPLLKGIGRRLAATFFGGALIGAAGGMRFDLVGWPVHDVNAAAIGFPSRDARRIVVVGIGDAAVVLFLEFVLDGIGRRIPPQPELLDELLTLFVSVQALECGPLFVSDNVSDVLLEPLFIRGFQLFP